MRKHPLNMGMCQTRRTPNLVGLHLVSLHTNPTKNTLTKVHMNYPPRLNPGSKLAVAACIGDPQALTPRWSAASSKWLFASAQAPRAARVVLFGQEGHI